MIQQVLISFQDDDNSMKFNICASDDGIVLTEPLGSRLHVLFVDNTGIMLHVYNPSGVDPITVDTSSSYWLRHLSFEFDQRLISPPFPYCTGRSCDAEPKLICPHETLDIKVKLDMAWLSSYVVNSSHRLRIFLCFREIDDNGDDVIRESSGLVVSLSTTLKHV